MLFPRKYLHNSKKGSTFAADFAQSVRVARQSLRQASIEIIAVKGRNPNRKCTFDLRGGNAVA